MRTYEGMFLVDNRHANRDWDRVVAHVKEIIAKHGGEVIKFEKWGERKLAYPVNGHKRATYLLTYFRAQGEVPNRIYREVELSETLLRALILAVESVPEVIGAPLPEAETFAEKARAKAPATAGPAAPSREEAVVDQKEAAPEGKEPAGNG